MPIIVSNLYKIMGFLYCFLRSKIGHELCMNIFKEEEMVALTRNEIVDELRKLGICSPAEIQDYSMEYMIYYQIKCRS